MPILSRVETTVSVGVAFVREEDYVVAYCPALELSAYGKNEQSAKKAFEEALKIFLEETTKKGTLAKVLTKLGWRKSIHTYEPPDLPYDKLWGLFKNNSGLSVRKEPVRLPQLAMN